jgi:hypothetical protein
LPENSWVFFWDDRRRVGHLLAIQPQGDRKELHFRVEREPRAVVQVCE